MADSADSGLPIPDRALAIPNELSQRLLSHIARLALLLQPAPLLNGYRVAVFPLGHCHNRLKVHGSCFWDKCLFHNVFLVYCVSTRTVLKLAFHEPTRLRARDWGRSVCFEVQRHYSCCKVVPTRREIPEPGNDPEAD